MDSDALKKLARAVISTKATAVASLSSRTDDSRLKGVLNINDLLQAGVV